MKKLINYLFLIVVFLILVFALTLSTIGVETSKFNKLISDKASKAKRIDLELDTIKFKLDIKEFSLFLETENPKITYSKVSVPVRNIKAYIDFLSLFKSDPKIKKTTLTLEELDITQLNKLSIIIKPSNFKSLINNKIKQGKLISEIEIFLNEQGLLKDFIAKGTVKNLEAELFNDFSLKQTNLSFIADNKDILIKNIFGTLENIKISDGDIKINLENGIKLNSNFNSKINFNEKLLKKYDKLLDKYLPKGKIKIIKAELNNNFSINLDNTYKIQDYNYTVTGKLEKSKFELVSTIKNSFIKKELKEIYFSDLQIKSIFLPNNVKLNGEGKYSFDNKNFQKINLKNNFKNNSLFLKLNFDYLDSLNLDLINFKKRSDTVANISLDLEKKEKKLRINKLDYKEENNSIKINGFKFNENNFVSFNKLEVATNNNNFFIKNGKTILIKGSKFDASNLVKFLNKKSEHNKFKKFNSNIEINFKDIIVPNSEKLKNFNLLGEIKKGQFVKISSKGDFGNNNFLDISMKKDKDTDKKYLEIYSDLTKPLLTEFGFFNGLSGGKLLFTSVIDNSSSNSKLRIENFKVVNAPGVIKLLSLADLGGLEDLAKGEGLSFEVLEIDMENNKNFLKINEILALGPSMSVLMEGYRNENGLTSLRGTLVPAKTLNKMISKIPVIGNIVIPKEVGEGLFGISFKMKGPKGKIKTTINPIRTITPRFIQKIIDRNKKTK